MSRLFSIFALIALSACAATTTGTGSQPALVLGIAPSSDAQTEIWICHGGRHPKWKKVASPAVAAHRRHGDRVVYTHQQANTSCTR